MKNTLLLSILVPAFILSACSSTLQKSSTAEPLSKVSLMAGKSRADYDAYSKTAVIATQGTLSSKAGMEILKNGGNLFDAFTAISFAIGVERPQSTGIGGGGFVLFYNATEKKVYAFDFRETAPRKAHSKMYLDADGKPNDLSVAGALAVATPGHVAGVLEIHRKYGKLKLSEVLKPAIRMAEVGFPVYPALNKAIESEKLTLARFSSSRKIFLTSKKEALPVGFLLKQKDLANTLKLIAAQGEKVFYQGEIAEKIAKSIKRNNGILDQEDLKNYQAKWREPVKSSYHQYELFSQPPPSSGGTHVMEILNIVEKSRLKESGPQSPRSIHLTASAMQQAFFDRAQFMGDPDFVSIPVAKLISKEYAAVISKGINEKKAKAAPDFKMTPESHDTTHFSLMDQEGNIIASTQTINGYFGSALVAEGTGIVLNNEMDDFAAQVGASNLYGAVGGENNLVQPLKRPLSSMSPTIVLKDGQPYMGLGTPSGTRIITCVAQTLLNSLEYDMSLWDSISATRYHHQWKPDELHIEQPYFSIPTMQALQDKGYKVVNQDLGCRIEAVKKEGDKLHAVSDPREEGLSLGL